MNEGYSGGGACPVRGAYSRIRTLCPLIVNASARPPRLVGLPTVGTCNYRYTGI